jgi:hypothetical protein
LPKEPHRDERKSASPWLSPGLVRSNEIVLRTVLDPDHLEADGKLASAAISLQDIQHRGWSVDRKYFTGLWRLRLFHSGWQKKRPNIRKFYVLPIPVDKIRYSEPTTGQQDFVVIDSAMWLNPAHSAVLLSGPRSQGAARGLRNNLLRKLPPYVDISEAFASSDRGGYMRGMLRQLAAILISPFRCIFRALFSLTH